MTDKLTQDPFWLVWNQEGRNPSFKHASRANATAEAERLARLHPGATFIVLESVCARLVDDMIRIEMQRDNIPF